MPLKETLISPGDNTESVARDLVSDLGLAGAVKACDEVTKLWAVHGKGWKRHRALAYELQRLQGQDQNERQAKRNTTRQRQENIVLAAVRMMHKDPSLAEDHEDLLSAILGELREEPDINAILLGEQGRALAESYMLKRRGKLTQSAMADLRADVLEDLRRSKVLEPV